MFLYVLFYIILKMDDLDISERNEIMFDYGNYDLDEEVEEEDQYEIPVKNKKAAIVDVDNVDHLDDLDDLDLNILKEFKKNSNQIKHLYAPQPVEEDDEPEEEEIKPKKAVFKKPILKEKEYDSDEEEVPIRKVLVKNIKPILEDLDDLNEEKNVPIKGHYEYQYNNHEIELHKLKQKYNTDMAAIRTKYFTKMTELQKIKHQQDIETAAVTKKYNDDLSDIKQKQAEVRHFTVRKDRGLTQKLYLIDKKNDYEYVIMGSTGNVYDVKISKNPTCSCPDCKTNGNRCKHIYFVLMRIMKLSDSMITQKTYSEIELQDMKMKNADKTIHANDLVKKKYKKIQDKQNNADLSVANTDDLCPVCLDDIENGEEYDYCKLYCNKAIHILCFQMWCKKNIPKCLFCQKPWNKLADGSEYINLIN